MGKGKGKISGAICKVEPGTVFFEIRNVAEKLSMAALLRASVKLPVRTQICTEG
jgi:ribosomal protein L16/L10AE